MPTKVRLIALSGDTPPSVPLAVQATGLVFACDFYVSGIEGGQEIPGGYRLDRLLNIDHHAPTERMSQQITSTTLAISQVEEVGCADPLDAVVVHHTDCDSVLSSGIMCGELEPDSIFSEVAIAADHTGEENTLADLLQALDKRRDLELSQSSLNRFLRKEPLQAVAKEALEERRRERGQAELLVNKHQFSSVGKLSYAVVKQPIDSEFFPALLPDTMVLMIASPRGDSGGYWDIHLRLGPAAPKGFSLHSLDLKGLDPNYGGRWNAGSNIRGGGTNLAPEKYGEKLSELLDMHLGGSNSRG